MWVTFVATWGHNLKGHCALFNALLSLSWNSFIIFGEGTLNFPFALGPTNYVASAAHGYK